MLLSTDSARTGISPLPLHAALPISHPAAARERDHVLGRRVAPADAPAVLVLGVLGVVDQEVGLARELVAREDRKSTRLNSSHLGISYAVFCLKHKILMCIIIMAAFR